jgi:hypothetical protein
MENVMPFAYSPDSWSAPKSASEFTLFTDFGMELSTSMFPFGLKLDIVDVQNSLSTIRREHRIE